MFIKVGRKGDALVLCEVEEGGMSDNSVRNRSKRETFRATHMCGDGLIITILVAIISNNTDSDCTM